MTNAGYRSDYELTTDTPYLDLSGELWSVFFEIVDPISGILEKINLL